MKSCRYPPGRGKTVLVHLPLDGGWRERAESLLAPLDQWLRATSLGSVTGCRVDGARAVIRMRLVCDMPRALKAVASMMDHLNAPPGTSLGPEDDPDCMVVTRTGDPRHSGRGPLPRPANQPVRHLAPV